MPFSASELPSTWEGVVQTALVARKNGATPSEVARLAKTLARLGAAAVAVTASHEATAPPADAPHERFEDVLRQLAHD